MQTTHLQRIKYPTFFSPSSSLTPSSLLLPGSTLHAPALDLVPRSQVSHPTWRPLSGAPCRRCDIAPRPRPPAHCLVVDGTQVALLSNRNSPSNIMRCKPRCARSCTPSLVEAEQTSRRAGMISSVSYPSLISRCEKTIEATTVVCPDGVFCRSGTPGKLECVIAIVYYVYRWLA